MKIPIDLKEFLFKNWIMIIIMISCVLVGYISTVFLGKDNPVEQEVEKIILVETGLTIDLTP